MRNLQKVGIIFLLLAAMILTVSLAWKMSADKGGPSDGVPQTSDGTIANGDGEDSPPWQTPEFDECGTRPDAASLDIREDWTVTYVDDYCLAVPHPSDWKTLLGESGGQWVLRLYMPDDTNLAVIHWIYDAEENEQVIDDIKNASANAVSEDRVIYDSGLQTIPGLGNHVYREQKWLVSFPESEREYMITAEYDASPESTVENMQPIMTEIASKIQTY
jgi:hypothetical protein